MFGSETHSWSEKISYRTILSQFHSPSHGAKPISLWSASHFSYVNTSTNNKKDFSKNRSMHFWHHHPNTLKLNPTINSEILEGWGWRGFNWVYHDQILAQIPNPNNESSNFGICPIWANLASPYTQKMKKYHAEHNYCYLISNFFNH